MAAPQLPVNFDPGFLRGGGRSCFVKKMFLMGLILSMNFFFIDSFTVMTAT